MPIVSTSLLDYKDLMMGIIKVCFSTHLLRLIYDFKTYQYGIILFDSAEVVKRGGIG